MKRDRLSWWPLFPLLEFTWARLCTQMAAYIENAGRPRPRDRPGVDEKQDSAQQKRLCVDLVHEDEWEPDGTVRILTPKQPLRAGFAERTLATSSRTYGGCRPCHGSSKLRSRSAQPKPPP